MRRRPVAPPLSRTSGVMLYQQLYLLLKESLHDHDPRLHLPSESALMARYAVSRNSVRRAIAKLIKDRLVESIAGRGTFIARAPRNPP